MAEPAVPCTVLPSDAGLPALADALGQLPGRGGVVGLAPPLELPALRQALGEGSAELGIHGPAVVVGSGGSSGGRRWCLQPLAQLAASAAATGEWLQGLGMEPSQALVVNPLPWHHVSGLMPWLRARQWGAEHGGLAPAQLRQPADLAGALPPLNGRPALLSLVPTQLHRLLNDPAGLRWLQEFAVIWVGGAPLAPEAVVRCRAAGLRLAPCYGSTETGSMVTTLAPEAFLAGVEGCGPPLPHARLRIASEDAAVEVRATSLSPGHLVGGRLRALEMAGGWWRSGDRGRVEPWGLTLLGRRDGAIHSGGETVFPEEVERALLQQAARRLLPVAALLLVARPDREWGERLVALVRPREVGGGERLMAALQELALTLPPAQRPREWRLCAQLEPNALGKWERARWAAWLRDQR